MTFNSKKIFVIGSNSFSGSNFINHALLNSNKIIGISRSNEYNEVFLPYKSSKNLNKFKFYKLDINKNFNKILDLIDNFKPEIIVNFSAQGEVRNSWNYSEQWYITNCLSVVNLCNALVKKRFIKKYIAISTPEVYGNTEKKITESYCFNPSTPYAASKLAGDLHLITLFKKYNFPVIFTRSANVYGPFQQLYRIIPRTIISLKKNSKIKLHGRGRSERSFIHINDAVNAIYQLISKGKNGEVYHIAPSKKNISIYSLVNYICQTMDYDFNSSVKLISENYGQDSTYMLSSKKIRSLLDWSENISLENGIKETILWITNNWKIISGMSIDYIHKK